MASEIEAYLDAFEEVQRLLKRLSAVVDQINSVAEAEKMKLDMTYHPPLHLERLVTQLYETPPAMIDTIKRLVPNLQ